MLKWQEYCDEAARYAAPYVHRAGETLESAAKHADRAIRKGRRKAKRKMRLLHIKRGLDLATHLLLILAAVIALFELLYQHWKEHGEA